MKRSFFQIFCLIVAALEMVKIENYSIGVFTSIDNDFLAFRPNYCKFVVSKKNISFIHSYFCRLDFGDDSGFGGSVKKRADKYLFNRYLTIPRSIVGLRIGVYRGDKFQSFRVRAQVVGSNFANFVRTYKFAPNLGLKKKHGYFGNRHKAINKRGK